MAEKPPEKRKRGRPRSDNPSKATLRQRRYMERLNNPLANGGPATPRTILSTLYDLDVLVAKKLLSEEDAQDLTDEHKARINQALTEYHAANIRRDHREMDL